MNSNFSTIATRLSGKRGIWPVLVLLAILHSTVPLAPQSFDARSIDDMVQDGLRIWEVPGASLAIVRDDRLIHLKGYGVKRLGTADPVTTETLFAIASTTKAFTTTAMAMLVDERKMEWDEPVRKHLEYFHLSDPLADQNVTLRDLVTHRTGLSRNDALWDRSPWSREEIIRRIAFVKPARPFRTTYQYNNIMFVAAGEAVGKAAGMTWDNFVRRRIFIPLGMSSANFSVSVAEKAADHATPHRKNKQGRIEVTSWHNVDNIGGAGCINAGARDMSQWLRFQLSDGVFNGKRLVSSENLAESHTPQIVIRMDTPTRALNPYTTQMSYGMGWIVHDYHGRRLLSHTGGLNGFRARIVLVPDEKLGIVILTNSSVGTSSASMHVAVTNNLLDLLLGFTRTDWNVLLMQQAGKFLSEERARIEERQEKRQKDTRPSHPLADYAGSYEEPAYGKATIKMQNGNLELHWSSFTTRLEHFHYDTFVAAETDELQDEQVQFGLDMSGEVARINFLGMDFARIKAKQ
jgi:CubicO group peptidase (beta-lactamase class C family)